MQSTNLNEILVFIQVVQDGSFTRAAKHLGMPNSTVSARISSLEKRLGVTLLQRTTRQLRLTQVGQVYYDQCTIGVEQILKAENSVTSEQSEPQGRLTISAPVFLGAALLPQIIAECSRMFPKIYIKAVLTDQAIDLIAEKVDIALRAGVLNDSTLILRKLGDVKFSAFASPKYVKLNGEPSHPKDLAQHSLIQFTPLGEDTWRFFNDKNSVSVPVPGSMLINELYLVKNLTILGNGIALLPDFICKDEAKRNRLIRVLPRWQAESRRIQFVHLPEKYPSPKLRSFMEIAVRLIKEQLAEV